jgi:putative transposase
MDLYSRRIVGWAIDKTMTTSLVLRALIMAYNLRRPPNELVFHSDRGSQYTSARYRMQLSRFGMRDSMGDVGASWDNAVIERFSGSLKHDWLFKVSQPTPEHMNKDEAHYIRYYNLQRSNSANGGRSPVDHELVFKNVAGTV